MTNLQQFFEGWRNDLMLERSCLEGKIVELQYRIERINDILEENKK